MFVRRGEERRAGQGREGSGGSGEGEEIISVQWYSFVRFKQLIHT
jgi:hypothetical protein